MIRRCDCLFKDKIKLYHEFSCKDNKYVFECSQIFVNNVEYKNRNVIEFKNAEFFQVMECYCYIQRTLVVTKFSFYLDKTNHEFCINMVEYYQPNYSLLFDE